MRSSHTAPTRQIAFDYDRTIVAFHGTRRDVAEKLISGVPFDASTNEDDWLGHGIYFWEYAPQRAWWWATRRYGKEAGVVGALVRLGRCIDLLDPSNTELLERAHADLERALLQEGAHFGENANKHKYRDCAVFNYLFESLSVSGFDTETTRAVFIPVGPTARLWRRSGIFRGAHIQLAVREANNILAVWPVKRDGRYGRDES